MKKYDKYRIVKMWDMRGEVEKYRYYIEQWVKPLFKESRWKLEGRWGMDYWWTYDFETQKKAEAGIYNLRKYNSIDKPKPAKKIIGEY